MRRLRRTLKDLPGLLLGFAFLVASGGSLHGQDPAPEQEEGEESGPRPFGEVVPESARTDPGVFTIHQTDEKLFFQIPDSLLGREMLLISRVGRVPPDFGGFLPAGQSVQEQVLTWNRRGDRILVRKESYDQVADEELPIAISVRNNNFAPIIAAFDVEAIGPDGASAVIDVTDFFEGDTPAISGLRQQQRSQYGVRRLDPSRSFINWARSFPQNVDVRQTLTYEASSPPSNAGTGTLSMEMNQSMVLLPREPMRPRYADPRVGYFTVDRVNFSLPTQKAATETFIRRWRLEPSDPAAYARGEPVPPVEPITYYVDPATPHEWRSCVRAGVLDWNEPFETAGFRDAVRVLDAPSPEEDPDWDMADVRHSVVRWAASMTRNAQGPSVSDPRTGEIIESDIVWFHNHMRSYRNRIMLETGAANPGARSLPIDEELMCEAMRQVIAHEIGHALGLPHNMIGSSSYPVEYLRDPDFAREMGVSPSIMDYARQNYIAQPGDGLKGADFIRQIGPYDHYAINWGYRVFPEAATPADERPILNRIILDHADDPMYRFQAGGGLTGADPRSQTEDLGDDPMQASRYGIANLRRVTPRLIEWTTRPGEDFSDLEELYGELLGQWNRYVNHVVTVIGGVYVDRKSSEQDGVQDNAVPRPRQEEALAFLAEHVFEAPVWLNDRSILDRIDSGGFETLVARQARVLEQLLGARRLQRMASIAVEQPENAYPLDEYLDDVEEGVFGAPGETSSDPYRRALHRTYVEALGALLEDPPEEGGGPGFPGGGSGPDLERSDLRPLARARLRELEGRLTRAGRQVSDRTADAHLSDLAARIRAILGGGTSP